MATQSVTPTLESELSTFAHKVLYAHLGIFVLLLALMAGGAFFGLKSYDKALAHAEALQAQFSQAQTAAAASQKALADLLAQDAQLRATESAQQANLAQQILRRDAQAPSPTVQAALQPTANSVNVILAIKSQHTDANPPVDPKGLPDGNIEITASEGRLWVSEKDSLNRFSADLKDTVQLYTLEQSKTTSLSNDLTQCNVTVTKDEVALADAKKSLVAYDKLANRSRFRKILGSIGRNAERFGIAVIAFEAGRKL